jgi:hypothetical protein
MDNNQKKIWTVFHHNKIKIKIIKKLIVIMDRHHIKIKCKNHRKVLRIHK